MADADGAENIEIVDENPDGGEPPAEGDAPPAEPESESLGEDFTPLCSNEDPEKEAAYKEYKRLVKTLRNHNMILESVKNEIQKLERKPCLTKCEKADLKNMQDTWQREMLKLKELIAEAIRLQNLGSKRHYKEFPLITTFDEDNLNLTQRTCETLQDKTYDTHARTSNYRSSAGESSDMHSCSYKDSQMSVAEERKLIKEICAALKDCGNLNESKQKKQNHQSCKGNDSMEKIKDKIKCMQQKISKLNESFKNQDSEIFNHQSRPKPCGTTAMTSMPCGSNSMPKTNNFQQLKENYLYLMTEYNKKDEELKELTKKLKSTCMKCSSGAGNVAAQGDGTTADASELHLLRLRIDEMKDEQVEFKCLMREQSLQLDDYRNKYLNAQQKVEEQCVIIEKLNMSNKCIEKQINQEVKEIRAKFQERLTDLLQFPQLLENEQLKLAQVTKEKEEIETKLIIVCKELKILKSKQPAATDEDSKAQLGRCQQELDHVKKNLEEVQHQKDMICEQLRTTTEDLNSLRSESAKIIARTKERAELLKQQQKEQIDRLEKKLAQCRATACLSVNDRESVIKEMQGQLNSLSYSFDAAQKQIKTLRNHIAYMSNENSYPIKC